jgi:hypothetical protein
MAGRRLRVGIVASQNVVFRGIFVGGISLLAFLFPLLVVPAIFFKGIWTHSAIMQAALALWLLFTARRLLIEWGRRF